MDRSIQLTKVNVHSEGEATRLFAEYEQLRKRMHLLWSVPARDMFTSSK